MKIWKRSLKPVARVAPSHDVLKTVNRGRRLPSLYLKKEKAKAKTTTVANGIDLGPA